MESKRGPAGRSDQDSPRRIDTAVAAVMAVHRAAQLADTSPAPRALSDKVRVLERGSDMVLATHFTPLGGRLGLVAQTVETVGFTRPEQVDFRLVRGPVPHVVEAFT